jgi:amidohydrolase
MKTTKEKITMNHLTRRLGMILQILIILITISSASTSSAQQDRSYTEEEQKLIDIRRDIHRHPEIAGQEERTSGLVADYLEKLGLEVQTGVGGYGVVGILKGGMPGPVVAYRADMDALLSYAPDPVSFKSETPGVRHICGHDIHTTVALGIARHMAANRENLPGIVKFIFQPAEENATGAMAMIEDGVLENPAPEAIFGVHCWPTEVGQVVIIEGPAMSGIDVVSITLSGNGKLKSSVIRSVIRYSRAIRNVSRTESNSNDFILARIFQVDYNREDNQWTLVGMVKASSDETHAEAKAEIEKILLDKSFSDITVEFSYVVRALPAMVNDVELARSTYDILRSMLGDDNFIVEDEMLQEFSEDFSFYQQVIPGALFFLGVSNEAKGIVGYPHTPGFAADEEAIFIGVDTMSSILLNYLQTH